MRDYTPIVPRSFGGTLTTGSNYLIAAAAGYQYLVHWIDISPAGGATLDVIQLELNHSQAAIKKNLARINVVGDANGMILTFNPPLLCTDVYALRISGTASTFMGVGAEKIKI